MQMKIQMNLPRRFHDYQLSYFLLPFLLLPWLLMLLFSCDNLRDSMFDTSPWSKGGGLCEGTPMPSGFCHTSYSSSSTYSIYKLLTIKFAYYLSVVLSVGVRALGDFHDFWNEGLGLQKEQVFRWFWWLFNLNEMCHWRCLCLDLLGFICHYIGLGVNIGRIWFLEDINF